MESDQDYYTITMPNSFDFDVDNITLPDYSWADSTGSVPSGTISVEGEDADILINGMSLKQTLQGLNDRLAILQVNPELEAEFDELHSLAEQYRALEKKLLEKKELWKLLKS